VTGGGWPPFDQAKKAEVENQITNIWGKAYRELAPDMGAYINEVYCRPVTCLKYPVSFIGAVCQY